MKLRALSLLILSLGGGFLGGGGVAWAAWEPSRSVSRDYARGVAALDVGELSEAETLFREVLDTEADCGMARHALGLALLRQNRKAEALAAFEQASMENPEEADAWVGLSLGAFAAQDFARAREAGERAVALAPASLEAQVALQQTLLRQGDLARARAALVSARGALPGPDIACLEAQVAVEAGDLDGAQARMGLCQEADPALAVAIQNQVAAATGQVAQAGRLAARMGLSATSGVARAVDAWQAGRQQEALTALDEVLELEPSRTDARLLRGRIRHELGNDAGAVSDLEAALGGEAWVDVAWTGAMSGILRKSQEAALQQRVAEGAELLVRILATGGELPRAEERLAAVRTELGELPEVMAAAAAVASVKGDQPAAWKALSRGLPGGASSVVWLDAAARMALTDAAGLPADVSAALAASSSWHHRYDLGLALRQGGDNEGVLALVQDAFKTPGVSTEAEAEARLAVLGHEAAVNLGQLSEADRLLALVRPAAQARPVARINHGLLRLNAGDAAGALRVLPEDAASLGPQAASLVATVQVRALAAEARWDEASAVAAEGAVPSGERFWLASQLAQAGRMTLAGRALEGTCEELSGEEAVRCGLLRGSLGGG